MTIRDSLLLLWNTSGFRLALRSIALSLAGAVIVFTIIYHASQTTVRAQLDGTVAAEQADIISDVQADRESITQSTENAIAESDGTFYALLAPNGKMLAGNFRMTPDLAKKWRGYETLRSRDGVFLPPHISALRGNTRRFADGTALYIAENASALLALNHLIARSFVAVFGTILALGLIGGYLAARTALHQVAAITRISEEIMQGDLTRRIALRGSGDEFDQLAISLNLMLARMQQLMVNLKQVSNDISHDLRSPLARLREHLERSRRRANDPELQNMLDEALAQVDAALGIFSALLRIAEVEAGARRSQFKPVCVSDAFKSIADAYEPLFANQGMKVEVAIERAIFIQGDRDLLMQMMANILDNTILHAAGSTVVVIRVRRDDHSLRISISDNGIGIPDADLERVLQRFVRLDASRVLPGWGLGLPLAAAIAELHQGKMILQSNAPGLTIGIEFPFVAVRFSNRTSPDQPYPVSAAENLQTIDGTDRTEAPALERDDRRRNRRRSESRDKTKI